LVNEYRYEISRVQVLDTLSSSMDLAQFVVITASGLWVLVYVFALEFWLALHLPELNHLDMDRKHTDLD
jgi:hypothetical protein